MLSTLVQQVDSESCLNSKSFTNIATRETSPRSHVYEKFSASAASK